MTAKRLIKKRRPWLKKNAKSIMIIKYVSIFSVISECRKLVMFLALYICIDYVIIQTALL